jgi:hypothetical protein
MIGVENCRSDGQLQKPPSIAVDVFMPLLLVNSISTVNDERLDDREAGKKPRMPQ